MKKFPIFFILISFILITNCSVKQDITPEEVKEIDMEAYFYGFPKVMGYKAMNPNVNETI